MVSNSQWAGEPYNASAFIKLETQTASSDAQLDFTGFVDTTKYSSYWIVLDRVLPSTDSAHLKIRTSADGGSTFDSGTNNYYYQRSYYTSTSTTVDAAGNDNIIASVAIGNIDQDEDGVNGTYHFFGMGDASCSTSMLGAVRLRTNTNTHYHYEMSAARHTNQADDAIRFYMSSGNIASGTITIFGIPK